MNAKRGLRPYGNRAALGPAREYREGVYLQAFHHAGRPLPVLRKDHPRAQTSEAGEHPVQLLPGALLLGLKGGKHMMPVQTRMAIEQMRMDGHGPTQIARRLGLSVNTVKSHIQRHMKPEARCPVCGKAIYPAPGRKQKKYCSDRCRSQFWNHQYRKGDHHGAEA